MLPPFESTDSEVSIQTCIKMKSLTLGLIFIFVQIALSSTIGSQIGSAIADGPGLLSKLSWRGGLLPRQAQDNNNSECCKRKKCKRKNFFKPPGTCKCIPCPPDTRPAPGRDVCLPDPDKDDPSPQRGKCPRGQKLDPAEGGQDENTEKPICVPDDSRDCEDDEIPTTRTTKKPERQCAKRDDEKERPRCRRTEFRQTELDTSSNSQVKYSCQKNRKFSRDKNSQYDKIKERLKKAHQDQRDKDRPKRKENRWTETRERERQRYQGKVVERNEKTSRKKARVGQCLFIVPFLMTSVEAYDLMTDFFDEEFVTSEDVLSLVPADIDDIDESVDITSEAYLAPWKADFKPIIIVNTGLKRRDLLKIKQEESMVTLIHNKRQFSGLASTIVSIIKGTNSALKGVTKGASRIAKSGTSKASRPQMKAGSEKVASNKNWVNCLKGKPPVK